MMQIIIPDTNLFFECKRLEDLPWGELGDGPFVVVLSKPVLDEIDKHKTGGNRTKKRALATFKRVRAMLEAGVTEIALETTSVDVTLRLARNLPIDDSSQLLDLTKTDDRLVAILAGLVRGGEPALLLTHDAGPASTASELGLPFKLIPDRWLRPPAQSDEQRRAAGLEAQLAEYKQAEPILSLRLRGRGEGTQTVRREIEVLEPLNDRDLDDAIETLRAVHPPKTDYSDVPEAVPGLRSGTALLMDSVRYEPPSDEDQETYLTETYPAWLAQCRSTLAELQALQVAAPRTSLFVELENEGSRPGSGVRITFGAQGDVRLRRPPKRNAGSDDEIEDADVREDSALPQLPEPPKPPKWREVVVEKANSDLADRAAKSIAGLGASGLLDAHPSLKALREAEARFRSHDLGASVLATPRFDPLLHGPFVPELHDPEAFYYDEWDPDVPVEEGALTCDRFRHKADTKTFIVDVEFLDDEQAEGSVLCQVHAENLTRPAELRIRIEQIVTTRKPMAELAVVLERTSEWSSDDTKH